MKTHRLLYVKWQGIDMRCTLEQVKSIPQSDISVDIRAVDWSNTGIEFCGCIVHEQLPDVIHMVIPSTESTLSYISVPLNHVKHYFGHKKIMREEWKKLILNEIDSIANSHIQQMQIEF
tara:strand:+ start:885 stop:1241 length:357 start_codon:yes stop_codon:yes gene_type:complete